MSKENTKIVKHRTDIQSYVGQVFNNIEVLEVIRQIKNTIAKAKCHCGTIFETRVDRLKHGYTKSCGCMKKQLRAEKMEEHTKRLPNGLTLHEISDKYKLSYPSLVRTYRLYGYEYFIEYIEKRCSGQKMKQKPRSAEIPSGTVFGELTVIKKVEGKSTKNHFYLCKCSCGVEKPIRKCLLLNNESHSCGCLSTSIGEYEIGKFVESLGLKHEKIKIPTTGFKHMKKCELDIYIPEKKIAIEFDSRAYHNEPQLIGRMNTTHGVKDPESPEWDHPKNYHIKKTYSANALGIRMIHVFDEDWESRKEQIKGYLKSALGMNKNRIGARELDLQVISKREASNFLKKYHILGNGKTHLALGLKNGNELLAVATFNMHHNNNSKQWVLGRWCVKEDWTIPGALSRMTKEGLRMLGADSLISWADLSYSDGKGYESSGWIQEDVSYPDYCYWHKSKNKGKTIHKNKRRKDRVGTPEGMTESEHAEIDGLLRIWDCGKIRFRFNNLKK